MGYSQIAKLLAVLVALTVVAYLSGAFDNAPSTIEVPVLEIKTDEIKRLEFVSPLHTVVVDRTLGSWQMIQPAEWAADEGAVSRFLGQLSQLQLENVVSMNEERYGRYGVDSAAVVIKFSDGKENYSLVMSENGPSQMSVYMRVNDDNRIFLASPRLPIPRSVSNWRDKRIAAIPALSVVRASVTSPEGSFSLIRGENSGSWTIESAGSSAVADSAKTMSWLSKFNAFSANGFVRDPEADRVHTHSLSFEVEDGSSITMNLAKEESRFVLTLDPHNGGVYYLLDTHEATVAPEHSSFQD